MPTTRDLDRDYVLHPFSQARTHAASGAAMMARSAAGCWITDDGGNRYLDAMAGLWCVNAGYGRERIADAMAEQAKSLSYFHGFSSMATEPAARLAERVMAHAPDGMRRIFFGASGSDANDTQVKLVWLYNNARDKPLKKKIIARDRGYHGVTVMAGGLTGLPGLHAGFDLPLPMVRHVSAPHNLWTRTAGEDDAAFCDRMARELDEMIVAEGPDTVGAFIAEPVQGAGGVIVPPTGYFAKMQAVLDRHDVLLIADEVITGFGRLGTWFGSEAIGMRPDLMSVAKGITSGYAPLSGVLVGERVWSVLSNEAVERYGVFGHGYTYTGHPVMAAAALANLDIVEEEGLVARAGEVGVYLNETLAKAFRGFEIAAETRGTGLVAAVEFARPAGDGWERFATSDTVAARVVRRALEDGVIVRALPNGDAVSFSPPFIATHEEIDLAVSTVRKAAEHVLGELKAEGPLERARTHQET